MSFTIDFLDDGSILEWESTANSAVVTERDDYAPRFYVAPRSSEADLELTELRAVYKQHPDVVTTEVVSRRPGFRRNSEEVLAVDVTHVDRVTTLARQTRQLSEYPIGDLACFNVDFSREFRYCLENDIDPTPASELSTLQLDVPVTETTGDSYTELSVDGETITGSTEDILTAVQAAVDERDPRHPRLFNKSDHPHTARDGHERWRRRFFAESIIRCRLPAARESVDVFELRPRRPLTSPIQRARSSNHR